VSTAEHAPTHGRPVAVVGSGPVGLSAALLLARWNLRVVLLERRTARHVVGSRSICQHRDVLDIWAAVGAGKQIATEGVTWRTARTYWREQELFALTLADPGHSPFPPFVNISQSRTEEILAERVEASPLIETRWGHEAVAIDQHAAGVSITCRTDSGIATVLSSFAIVCAGGRADELRDSLGLTFGGPSFDDQFLICDISADLPGWEVERRFYFDPAWNPGRQVLIHPCPGSTYRIDWQVPPGFDLDAEERSGRLDERIRRIVGDRAYKVVWRSVYSFASQRVDRMRVGRVLLAGDTAHIMAPFGARGLNSGVQDVENAAWKIAFVRYGWAPESLLESYHDERHAAALENLEVTGATMRFLVPHTGDELIARRDALEAASRDPTAASRVDSGRLAEPFWYPESPLTMPDPSRPAPSRPPRGQLPATAPGVIVPDTPIKLVDRPAVTRLREIARDGLLALTSAEVDARATEEAMRDAVVSPCRAYSIPEIDIGGQLNDALGARVGETFLIRPDAHLAAIVPPGAGGHALAVAARRALGNAEDSESAARS
jgi:3-(3-hydroxy-phenyl)propionate hydroxylase